MASSSSRSSDDELTAGQLATYHNSLEHPSTEGERMRVARGLTIARFEYYNGRPGPEEDEKGAYRRMQK